MTTITLPLPEPVVWSIGALVFFALASLLVVKAMAPAPDEIKKGKQNLQERFGLSDLPIPVLLGIVAFWGCIFFLLSVGLVALILEVFLQGIPAFEDKDAIWQWRFSLAKLVTLTGVLGAVVALPFTVLRIALSRAQVDTARDALFNDKINAAANGLYARRQISRANQSKKCHDLWQDDIVQRNAAIFRLLKLAEEDRTKAGLIAGILSSYLRANEVDDSSGEN